MSLTDSSSTPVGDGASQYSPTPAPTSIYAAAQQPPPHTPRNVTYTLSTIITVIDEPPSYRPSLQDGTLLTSTYIAAARDMTVFLFVGGIVLAVFLRNIVVAAKYLRTVAARDKSLFYLLFFAQIWGPVAVLAMLLPIAVESVNCTASNLVAALSIQISFTVLLSGILGIKAYRCLNKLRSVLLAICITQISALALSAYEIPKFKSVRTVAGVCVVPADLKLIPTAFILNTIETLVFVGMCFGYAIWNASKRSANLGRLSLDLSNEPAATRGWWDYAPTIAGGATIIGAPSIMRSNSVSTTGRADLEAGGTNLTARSGAGGRAADQLTLGSLARKGVRGVAAGGGWEKIDDEERAAAGSPPPRRRGSQQSDDEGPKFTRIVLLNDAVKNELFYTGLILAFHTPAMVMFPVSARYTHLWPPVFWLGMSWCITSVLVIRSFAPVIERHEREAILREPLQPGWAPDPLDAPSGPPRPKQTPWGRAVSFSTNSVLSYPNVRRRGSTATSAAQSIAFSSAAHSNAFQSKEWINAKRSKLDLVSSEPRTASSSNSLTVVGSSSKPAGSTSTAGAGSSKLRTGTTATALIPLNSSTVWAGSSTPNNPFADPARTPNGQVGHLVDVTVLPNSPNATGPAPELWRRGSVSGLSITSASGLPPSSQPGPSRPRHTHARRNSQDIPPTASRRGSAAGLGIAGVPLVPIGEAPTPLATSFDLVDIEQRPSSRSRIHLVEPNEVDYIGQDPMSVPMQVVGPAATELSALQSLDLEAQPRSHIRDLTPRQAKERRVRDGSRTIAFDLDVGVLGRNEAEYESTAERRQFGSADALLGDRR